MARNKPETTRAYWVANREHINAMRRQRTKKNPWPERRRQWKLRGIDPTVAEQTLKAHGGKCDICLSERPGGRGGWQVDHDHRTGLVRGVLCVACNTVLGRIEAIGLAKLSHYLSKGVK